MSARLRVLSTIGLLSLTVGAIAAAGAKGNPDEVRIGFLCPLTGVEAPTGAELREAFELACSERNADGGIKVGVNKRKVRLVLSDCQGKPDETSSVQRLIRHHKVQLVVGSFSHGRGLSAAELCQKHQIPIVILSTAGTELTKKGEYVFRVPLADTLQATAMARFARNTLKAKTAGLFVEKTSASSATLGARFQEVFKSAGGEIVSEQTYGSEDFDFRIQLTGFKDKNPDVIYIPGSHTSAGQIALQSRDLGLTSVLLGGDGWDSPKLLEIAGSSVEGAFYCAHFHPKEPRASVARFVDAYGKRFTKPPSGLAALGYDIARLVMSCVERAGSLKGPALQKAVASARGFSGVTGSITIDKERTAEKSTVIVSVTSSGVDFREIFTP